MPELADLLVLVHDSDQRWGSVDVVSRTEIDLVRLQEAARPRPEAATREVPAEPGQVERRTSASYRIRAARDPWRTRWERLDHQGNDPNGLPPELVVDDGEALWEQLGKRVSRNRLRMPRTRPLRTASAMLSPHDLGAAHHLTVSGTGVRDRREVWLISARPRDPVLPRGALLVETRVLAGELAIDVETGILLSARWFHQGLMVLSSALTDLRVDPPLDPGLFDFHPPPDAQITEGMRIPTQFVPAATVGILTAVVGDRIARLFRRGAG
jgi:hypothetical protein